MSLSYQGFNAKILCGGKELRQYAVEEVDDRTIKCFIPSEVGKVNICAYNILFSSIVTRHVC
jgi:hypothetical protein